MTTFSVTDHKLMARAIQLAKKGQYSTTPNPCVGCVITDGKKIAEGFHKRAGEAHAEINALHAARQQKLNLIQSTCYVTLEPCSHYGKTPPCAEALIHAGVKRVVYAMQDPNPSVAGCGITLLQSRGIQVAGPLLEEEAYALNRGFFQRMKTGKPWVFAKTASSLDGRTAMMSGESKWITGKHARASVQQLRASSCAIITGISTIMADNPSLTVRDDSLSVGNGPLRQPLRVIVDSHLRTPLDAAILHETGECLIAFADSQPNKIDQLTQQGIETIQLPNTEGRVDLNALIEYLAKHQCNQVMLEAGPTLLGAFLQQQLLDEIKSFVAPTLLGSEAKPLAQLPFDSMSQQINFELKQLKQVGNDLQLTLTPNYRKHD